MIELLSEHSFCFPHLALTLEIDGAARTSLQSTPTQVFNHLITGKKRRTLLGLNPAHRQRKQALCLKRQFNLS